jgi:hypothetical protein
VLRKFRVWVNNIFNPMEFVPSQSENKCVTRHKIIIEMTRLRQQSAALRNWFFSLVTQLNNVFT